MKKLARRNLAITRNENDSREFQDLVRSMGGCPISLQTFEIVLESQDALYEFLNLVEIHKYSYCAFLSQNAVMALFNLASRSGKIDTLERMLRDLTVIAVGPKTAQILQDRGISVGLVPEKFSSYGLVELLSKNNPYGKKVIIPRSKAADRFLKSKLSALGMCVTEVFTYDLKTAIPDGNWMEFIGLLKADRIDAIVFTSPSAVESFFDISGRLFNNKDRLRSSLGRVRALISIGPMTAGALESRRIKSFQPAEHTIKDSIDVAIRMLSG